MRRQPPTFTFVDIAAKELAGSARTCGWWISPFPRASSLPASVSSPGLHPLHSPYTHIHTHIYTNSSRFVQLCSGGSARHSRCELFCRNPPTGPRYPLGDPTILPSNLKTASTLGVRPERLYLDGLIRSRLRRQTGSNQRPPSSRTLSNPSTASSPSARLAGRQPTSARPWCS